MLQLLTDLLQNNALSILLASIICCLLASRWYRKPARKFPPGPRGLPLVGVIPFVGSYPERVIRKWGLEKYGEVMSARLGSNDMVFLNSFDAVQQAFAKQSHVFSGRPHISILQDSAKSRGIILKDYGKEYKMMRAFGKQTLKQFGIGRRSKMEDIVNYEADCCIERLRKKNDQTVNVTTDISIATANVVFSVVFGRRCEENDPTFRRCIWLLHNAFANERDSPLINVLILFYPLRHIPPFRGARERWLLYMNELSDVIVRNEFEEHKAKFNRDDVQDFIDACLLEQKNGNQYFTDGQITYFARDLFGAGVVSSVTQVRWLLVCLLHHPQYQDEIYKEVNETMGSNGNASLSMKSGMPLTFAFVQEVLRYRPVSPIGLPHCATENANLMGFHIPKGTTVTANIWAVNYDASLWKNPEMFDPRRHLDQNGEFVYSEKILTFSLGPRICLGESLARIELFVFFAKIVQNFVVLPAAEKLPSLDEGTNTIAFEPFPFDVILEDRHC